MMRFGGTFAVPPISISHPQDKFPLPIHSGFANRVTNLEPCLHPPHHQEVLEAPLTVPVVVSPARKTMPTANTVDSQWKLVEGWRNETTKLFYQSLSMLSSCQSRPPLFKSLKSDCGRFGFDYSRRAMTCDNLWFAEERMWMRDRASPAAGPNPLAPGLGSPTTQLLSVALLPQTPVTCSAKLGIHLFWLWSPSSLFCSSQGD